jgi:hypothetical protein
MRLVTTPFAVWLVLGTWSSKMRSSGLEEKRMKHEKRWILMDYWKLIDASWLVFDGLLRFKSLHVVYQINLLICMPEQLAV